MSEPILFICRLAGEPGPNPEIGATLVLLETPHGRVAQAFETESLARIVWGLYGAADGVFLLPETRLTPELKQQLRAVPVVIYRTMKDYSGATLDTPLFPWPDRLVHFGTDAPGDTSAAAR